MPGETMLTPSSLVMRRSGAASSGVVSSSELLVRSLSEPWVPSSAMEAALSIWVTPEGTGSSMVTAKVAEPLAPIPTSPIVSWQTVPAGLPSAQLHPAVLAPALKVVSSGTVSLITTPLARLLPRLL